MHVFNNEFNIDEYIEKRTLEIEDLENRRMFKNVVSKIFVELYAEVKKEYDSLENRVLNEISHEQIPDIITNITPRDIYDVTDEFLRPVRLADLTENKIELSVVQENLGAGKESLLYMIFLEAEYLQVCKFSADNMLFSGTVKTKHNEYKATFKVKRNNYYIQQIEKLYAIFQENYYLWRSACAPYFMKLFDVYLIKADEWNDFEDIIGIEVDFAEFKEFVRYDQIPLWNIEELSLKTSAYPEPLVDYGVFEHRIFKHKFVEGDSYLVSNPDVYMYSVRRIDGDLLIQCMDEDPVDWVLYHFPKRGKQRYINRLMSNGQQDTLAARLRAKFQHGIRTKLDLAQWLSSFYYNEDLSFVDVQFVDSVAQHETYLVDTFVVDEMRAGKDKMIMLLMFKAHDENCYLNRDIMSFLVSSVQAYFPEYECCGQLV